MFNKDSVVNIEKLLDNNYLFFAHKVPGKEKEILQEHTNRCIKHFEKIIKDKMLTIIFQNFEKVWFPKQEKTYLDLFQKLIINVINFHDIGKINPLFQRKKMENKMFLNENGNVIFGTDHSIISAILYLEYFLPKSKDFPKEIRNIFRMLTYVNAYVISKHHGKLDKFENFMNSFNNEGEKNAISAEIVRQEYKRFFIKGCIFFESKNCNRYAGRVLNYIASGNEDSICLYAYEKLLYSLLVASDYYATAEYTNGYIIESHGTIEDIPQIIDAFNNTFISKNIEEYRNTKYYQKEKNFENLKDINVLRSEMYLDAEETLLDNLEENIYYLEAPTGSGKSNVAFNLSFQLISHCKEINKIMYIYPFNTLIEQNMKSIKKIFGENEHALANISVVNSVTPILKDEEDYSFIEYEKALLDRQFFNYPITLSTHVTLFDLMFGNRKESGFAFYQLSNSVIVLDEIQSYKNTIWTEIISFLKGFSKILNSKIIIMSATLPNLDFLSDEQNNAIKLINNRDKYFQHPLFKNRVLLNYELLDDKDILIKLDSMVEDFLNSGKKILIEFIKKKSAIEFYKNFINSREDKYKMELMTGDDSNVERERILNELETTEEGIPFLLVATQVIEAGVDLNNIDIGFKDISKVDSEEQFMGRVNRSCKKEGIVYFFDYDNAKSLYKKDIRINDELTLKSEVMREILREKKFNEYYLKVLKLLKEENESFAYDKNIKEFFAQVGKLDVGKINDRMKLIDDDEWSCPVFLNKKVTFSDNQCLEGDKVWNEYKQLLKNKNAYEYAEWKIKLSIVKSKMNYFTYQINKSSLFPYTEQLGELFYIDDAEQYFEGGKFIREKLENQTGTFI